MTARLGLIIPSSNRMVEEEMCRYYPAGVQPHIARLRMTGPHRMQLNDLLPRITEATASLTDARCDAVTFHCTATSMEEGREGDARILAAMRATGLDRAATTASAICRAFDALGAKKIVVLTPYPQRQTTDEVKYLESSGYEILSATGYDLGGSDVYCATPHTYWIEKGLECRNDAADVYLLSCAAIQAFEAIAPLEEKLGRPVITSNQAVLWDGLSRIRWSDRKGCPGRLFRCD